MRSAGGEDVGCQRSTRVHTQQPNERRMKTAGGHTSQRSLALRVEVSGVGCRRDPSNTRHRISQCSLSPNNAGGDDEQWLRNNSDNTTAQQQQTTTTTTTTERCALCGQVGERITNLACMCQCRTCLAQALLGTVPVGDVSAQRCERRNGEERRSVRSTTATDTTTVTTDTTDTRRFRSLLLCPSLHCLRSFLRCLRRRTPRALSGFSSGCRTVDVGMFVAAAAAAVPQRGCSETGNRQADTARNGCTQV